MSKLYQTAERLRKYSGDRQEPSPLGKAFVAYMDDLNQRYLEGLITLGELVAWARKSLDYMNQKRDVVLDSSVDPASENWPEAYRLGPEGKFDQPIPFSEQMEQSLGPDKVIINN